MGMFLNPDNSAVFVIAVPGVLKSLLQQICLLHIIAVAVIHIIEILQR